MKLTDLDPSWIVEGAGRNGMGVMFWCPHCRDRYVGVMFANPIDRGPPPTEASRTRTDANGVRTVEPLWQRTGETFETLTLTPSIDVSKSGHWHGFVTNGEVT